MTRVEDNKADEPSVDPARRAKGESADAQTSAGGALSWVLWALLLIGLIPVVGVVIEGSWNQTELAFAVLAIILAVAGLVAEHDNKRRNKRD